MTRNYDTEKHEATWPSERAQLLPSNYLDYMDYKRRQRRLSRFEQLEELVELTEQMEESNVF